VKSGFSSQGWPPSSASLAAMSTVPESGSDGAGSPESDGGGEGGSGVGVPGMNSRQDSVTSTSTDKTNISLLEFIPFSSKFE
jgi:hypothetical protein